MVSDNGKLHGAVDLGAIPRQVPEAELPQFGVQVQALVRRLSADGTYRAGQAVRMPNGGVQASPARESYMDAEQLIEAIGDTVRAVVKQELRAFAVRIGKPEVTE